MPRTRPARSARACRLLACASLTLLTAQLTLAGLVETAHPELTDPRYGCRLRTLQARRAAEPHRPLVLALGSSRTEVGLRPELMPPSTDGPLVFNLARGGTSQVMNLLTLRRLLADGVRPDWLLLEVLPACLAEEGGDVTVPELTARDLPCSLRYPIGAKPYARA